MDEMYKELPVKISPHLHMMQHVYRSTIYNLEKQCFLNTEIVVTSTQHDIEKCLPGVNCVRHMVDTDLAHTQHYTGWRLMIDQKYDFTVTPFWPLRTFYAYGGHTRCGPFNKICLSSFLEPI